jgi:ATP synthase protein I
MNERDDRDLAAAVERDSARIARAGIEHAGILAQTAFLGTLGVLFVIPVVAGAYLGLWLDGREAGYSWLWTMAGIAAGLAVGAFNVWRFVRVRR